MTAMNPPFAKTHKSLKYIQSCAIIALMPVLLWSVYLFGARVITQTLISVFMATLSESIYFYYSSGRDFRLFASTMNFHAPIITGILIAMMMPSSAGLYIPLFAPIIATILFRSVWGGVGHNLLNPAVAAAVISGLAFSKDMTSFVLPYSYHNMLSISISEAYLRTAAAFSPLQLLQNNEVYGGGTASLFYGVSPGCNGEAGIAVLLLAGAYLCISRAGNYRAGITYIASLFIISFVFPRSDSEAVYYALWQVMSGGVVFLAVFACNDPVTTPIRGTGKYIFGFGCGVLTYVLRLFVPIIDGAYIALLVMNLLTPVINKLTVRLPYGLTRGVAYKDPTPKHSDDNDDVVFIAHDYGEDDYPKRRR